MQKSNKKWPIDKILKTGIETVPEEDNIDFK